ncbi:hypothetical protein [Spirillospora sp. NBC_01491]|uniref:hypothetical protein n=1 Tax=Spirillospora sp. NBC_01491 TaxID=2976007 RepID=UPI002E32B49B|nr:hypothetical protein [Spirillospora sp. NBC_01491]
MTGSQMVRHWTRAGTAIIAVACCAVLPSSAIGQPPPTLDAETTHQLTVAAGTLLRNRSEALIQKRHHEQDAPSEIMGVLISPSLERVQEQAVHELGFRGRAPVEGGPAFTGARTRLDGGRAVRTGDRITLEATEHTEVRYDTGKVTQSVRRRFEFTTRDERITMVGERVLDPAAHPLNDLDGPSDGR